MRKIDFTKDLLPHLVAIVVFYIITIAYFNPVIFDNKSVNQHDIQQWEGSSKELRDFREQTGEEGLWANSMFSGMPAYLINVEWSDQVVTYIKIISSLGLPHPVRHIFLAFLSFYIMLLCFRINPWLALPGALAFGLSSYIMIGISAGHNARIGAIAFTPLVVGGFHLLMKTDRRWIGALLMSLGTALHLRENHLQITYYLLLILFVYGVIILFEAYQKKELKSLFTRSLWVIAAGLLAIGTYSGKFWTTLEYSKYSMRGPSELNENLEAGQSKEGLSKAYAFQYSNGILEPMTLLIPDFYGGASSNLLVADQESETYKILSQSQDPQTAQQLVRYTSSYWGNQTLSAPYYAGAIIVFLFLLGLLIAERKYVIWLTVVAGLGIMLSWGDSFSSFNYFMFDYFPGYNKFRSVTFALYLPLFALPLLGSLGLQNVLDQENSKELQKKILIALISTAGLCLLVFIFAGMASFSKQVELQLPQWFLNALREDRKSLMRGDALRSLGFILAAVVVIYLGVRKSLNRTALVFILTFLVTVDLYTVSKRYLNENNFVRSTRNAMSPSDADRAILQDNTDFRVFNIAGDAFVEARTSYFHSSIGGYHGAKLRRYQELYDQHINPELSQLISGLQNGTPNFSEVGVINMLNVKYYKFGSTPNEIIENPSTNGPAWMISSLLKVNSPDEEITSLRGIDTKTEAIIDASKFDVAETSYSTGSITVVQKDPNYIKYTSEADGLSLAVFSEIFYPVGWTAMIDGQATEILRVNYVLRALEIPAGTHEIEFRFEPNSYVTGNKIVLASNILLGLLLLFSLYKSFKSDS